MIRAFGAHCQLQTHAAQQKTFDHLVGECDQLPEIFKAKRLASSSLTLARTLRAAPFEARKVSRL
jgi:hypothetical protein